MYLMFIILFYNIYMEVNVTNFKIFNGRLSSYIYKINSWPILSLEKEYQLTNRFYYCGDLDSAKELILYHLRFVMHIAKNYSGYGLPEADLIQEGNIGLMKAVKKFNPFYGVRVISFAIYWIKAEIHEYILKNWKIVKIATTKSQRKLFFNLRKMKKKIGWFNNKEVKNVARKFNVSKKDVREMECRMFSKDLIIDKKNNFFCSSFSSFILDKYSNFSCNFEKIDWEKYNVKRLKNALNYLDNRSKHIIKSRWLYDKKKTTLKKLAIYYSVSAERIRQLEKNAMKKLKFVLERN